MATHQFGGNWTTDKLEVLRKYLSAYTTVFTGNTNARYFTTVYVDALAGTGHRIDAAKHRAKVTASGQAIDPEAESFKKGSARIALDVDPSFHRFIFVERAAERVKELSITHG